MHLTMSYSNVASFSRWSPYRLSRRFLRFYKSCPTWGLPHSSPSLSTEVLLSCLLWILYPQHPWNIRSYTWSVLRALPHSALCISVVFDEGNVTAWMLQFRTASCNVLSLSKFDSGIAARLYLLVSSPSTLVPHHSACNPSFINYLALHSLAVHFLLLLCTVGRQCSGTRRWPWFEALCQRP